MYLKKLNCYQRHLVSYDPGTSMWTDVIVEYKYYRVLIQLRIISTPRAITDAEIGPPALRVHSSLTLTVRPRRDRLMIRTIIQISERTQLSRFTSQLYQFSIAKPCDHNPRDLLDKENAADPVPTLVGNPFPPEMRSIFLVLTHGNPEAQFLSGYRGLCTLF